MQRYELIVQSICTIKRMCKNERKKAERTVSSCFNKLFCSIIIVLMYLQRMLLLLSSFHRSLHKKWTYDKSQYLIYICLCPCVSLLSTIVYCMLQCVSISTPLSVMRYVCSHCALSEPSSVRTIHSVSSSSSPHTYQSPAFIMGSMVNVIPGTSSIPVPLCP